jgi:predicted permease
MRERGITNVIVMGVHANMCVLGRPFSIRQMRNQRQNVVLLVCAGNVANLWLASSASRANDLATRRVLGASRLDVWRLCGAEAALIAAFGTALALVIAMATLIVAGRVIPSEYRLLGAPVFTDRAAAFGLLAALLVGAVGMLPVLFRTARAASGGGLPSPAGGQNGRRMRAGFVALQTCLATILTIGALLLGHSYLNLEGQQIGFDPDVIAITAVYPTGRDAPSAEVYDASADRLLRLPGVTGVAIFFGNIVLGDLAEVVGRLTPPSGTEIELDGRRAEVTTRTVSPGFFEVTGLDIVEGRPLRTADAVERGVVVNQAFASLFGSEDRLLGRTLRVRDALVTIVGVVEDAFERRFTDRPAPTVYDVPAGERTGALTYLMRADSGTSSYAISARRALFDVEPDVTVVEMNTLGTKLSNTVRDRSFAAVVLLLFGVAGVGVTGAGLVGIVAFTVARRTRDIATRVALGASRGHVRWVVVSEVLIAALVGIAAGLVAGRWLSSGLESLVYGVEAGNWITAVVSAVVMLIVSALAAVVPAQRAVRMQPTRALRIE